MVTLQHAPERSVQDQPPAGRYEIDSGHSTVGFEVRHMMLTRTRGTFHAFSGIVVIDSDTSASTVEVVIAATSIDTGNPERDEHLRSGDFFLADEHPDITFRSTAVYPHKEHLIVEGFLTMRGVSRPVTLRARFEGSARDPWGDERIAFTATTQIDRYAWDMTWNMPLEGSGLFVGREITINLVIEAVRSSATA